MNVLPDDKKLAVLAALVEGNSLRATTRMTGVHRTTVTNLMLRVGQGCAEMMDERMRNLELSDIQVDEIWTFVGKKQARLSPDEFEEGVKGDQYVFVALDADTKLVPAFFVGKRTGTNAYLFLRGLQRRIVGEFQLTTDAFPGYSSIATAIGRWGIDYAQQVKHYVGTDAGSGRS